jgi:membrane associated rhomboid family serine protease
VIPLKDENPSRTFPITTLLLIAANVIVFAYEATLPDSALQGLLLSFGAVPSRFRLHALPASASAGTAWLTLLTSMFLHGGYLHLGGNMLYLWIFGDNVEDAMGHLRFLAFYLLCGSVAGLVQIVAMSTSRVPLVGASGAIAGILGAYVLLYPAARVRTLVVFFFLIRIVSIPAFFVLGFWFLLQLLSVPASSRSGVAFFAHIGGFLAGMSLIGLFQRRQGRRLA